jgi:PAS domain S-box-containing protein
MFLSTFRDITERKKQEEQIRHAAGEWRMTFDSITDLVSIIDREFRLVRVNKAFAHAFGMHPKEVVGKTCYELVREAGESWFSYPHKKTAETKKPNTVEFFEPHLKIYLEVSTSPIFDDKGEVVATVHTAKDITQRKEIEKYQRLSQLGKLVADMAHEVNNPLMIISGNAQLSLMEGTKEEEIKNNLRVIFEESHRAKDIIQRLLRFSRPSKGETKEVDINNSIEKIVAIVKHQFMLVNVKIKRNYLENPPLIAIDEQQMQEVFMNLVNNAKEAMPNGGTITITTSLEEDFLRIDFKDTGCGMSEEVKKKLVEPFFTTKEKGTGLGLAVCYGIVKAYNGELKFESELNKGATATVLLPLRG